MRLFRIVTAVLPLLALAPAAAAAQPVAARELVQTVDSALAGVAEAAMDPAGGLDRRKPGFAPFWSALAGLRLRVIQIETARARRDGDFFLLLDPGSADLGALRVAWARTGAGNAAIAEGLRTASSSYRALRANYGREAFRHRQGGDLSEAERRQFQRIQRLQRRFAASLAALRESARRRGDEAAAAELRRFQEEAERIAAAPLALEAYLNALISSGETRGEWEADLPYLSQDVPEALAAADEMVQDLYVESDIGQVFTVDLGDGAWSSLDREAEAPAAVQLFAPAGEVEPTAAQEIAVAGDDTGEGQKDTSGEIEDLPLGETVEEEGIVEEEDLGEAAAAAPEADPAAAPSNPPAQSPQESPPAKTAPASPSAAAPAVSPPIG
ncbi:MAG TPA: hypothetical protein VIC28_11080 [Thermoanaerobaculia bacterium]